VSNRDAPFRIQVQVDYADTDAMAVVYHANYFRWFERARVEWLKHLGLSYAQMERDGFILPLREAHINYIKPLRFDDHPEVEVTVSRLRAAGIDLMYRVLLKEQVMTTGMTSHVLCRKDEAGELFPVKIPQQWRVLWQVPSVKKS
jgi:acyl-CoA thioester hydrolase